MVVKTRTTAASTNGVAHDEPQPEVMTKISIDKIAAETIKVPIVGTAPLIVNRFSEKSKRKMLDDMQGRKKPKDVKNPAEEYDSSLYRITARTYGFPVLGFKSATVGGARFYDKSVSMVGLRQFLFFSGVPSLEGSDILTAITGKPRMREDYVRVGRGGTDLRYRAEFPEWSAVLSVTYVTSMITRASVLSLIDAGGMAIGVGEWRPEKGGLNGTYQVDMSRKVEVMQ